MISAMILSADLNCMMINQNVTKKTPKNLQNGLISTIAMREHNLCGKIHQMTGNW